VSRHVVFLIEALTTGGAQRQMHELAVRLRAGGDRVSLVTYHLEPYEHREHFRQGFEDAGVPVTTIELRPLWRGLPALRRAVRRLEPDVLVAFLWRPSLLAELIGLPRRRFAVVVSERTGRTEPAAGWARLRLGMHLLADAVVVNSAALERYVAAGVPRLRHGGRLRRITNGVDLDRFSPGPAPPVRPQLSILAVGRFRPEKNFDGLLAAVEQVRRDGVDATVDWYGNAFFSGDAPTERSGPYLAFLDALAQGDRASWFRLHPPTDDIVPLYRDADVVCLPSLVESFPNVVCEALACGRPVLASRISDVPTLVRDGESGWLFDPRAPADIAAAIARFDRLDPEQRAAMGRAGRATAERLLDPEALATRWRAVLDDALRRRTT